MKKLIEKFAVTTKNGLVLVNSTPHPLNFVDTDGTEFVVPTSVPEGEKTGPLVINARPVEERVDDLFVKTTFRANSEGEAILDNIDDYASETGKRVVVIGSMIAVNAFPGRVAGMIPAPGFERVPPAQKKMRCDKFTIASDLDDNR